MQIGDTVTYYLPKNAGFYDLFNFPNERKINNPYYYKILSIDSVVSDEGKTLRRWYVDPQINLDGNDENCNFIEEIIEGIGPTGGFFNRSCSITTNGHLPKFRCFSSHSINYREINDDENCMILATNNLSLDQIHIYPNPVRNELFIETEIPIKSIEILNTKGQQLYHATSIERINTSYFPTGLYMIRLMDSNGNFNNMKFVKL